MIPIIELKDGTVLEVGAVPTFDDWHLPTISEVEHSIVDREPVPIKLLRPIKMKSTDIFGAQEIETTARIDVTYVFIEPSSVRIVRNKAELPVNQDAMRERFWDMYGMDPPDWMM